jgi:TolB protein
MTTEAYYPGDNLHGAHDVSKATALDEVKEAGMFGKGRGHGGIAALVTTGAVVVLGAAACGVTGTGSSTAATSPAAAHPTAQQAAAQAGTATPHQAPAGSTAPWNSVGAGWVLATYSAGTRSKPAPTTLYLISPAGAKYPLFTWPASATPTPALEAWAGDKTRALLQLYARDGSPAGYGELNLTTGTMTRVAFGNAATTPLGYTLPDGQQILAVTQSDPNSDSVIARYTRAGALVQTLVTVHDAFGASYSPDGAALAVPAPDGLLLVSNSGGKPRKLPIPGAAQQGSCQPVRWWNADTILASCGRLWLVPASGASPSALTPARGAKPAFDFGDIDAWQLPSGLYLQSLGACGTLELNKQASGGAVSRVTVPGMTASPVVVAASATQLLIKQLGCEGHGGQLAWYNPATGAELWLFKTGAGPSVIPYNDQRNGAIH